MEKYSIDTKAAEYLQIYAAFEEQLATWKYLFDETTLTKTLDDISEIVETAYEINDEAGLLPEDDTFNSTEKFILEVRFDPAGLKINGLKDVPRGLEKAFDMNEADFKRWMQEEREALNTAFVDMEDLIESIDDYFETPVVLEEMTHIFNEALDPDDPSFKVLDQFAVNLVAHWEDFAETAKSLISLSLNINEDIDRAALPAIMYDP